MSDNRRKPDPEERKRRIVLIVVALAWNGKRSGL